MTLSSGNIWKLLKIYESKKNLVSIPVQLQAVSSTLAGAMKVRKTESGPRWFIALYLNDGSDYIQVRNILQQFTIFFAPVETPASKIYLHILK